MCKIGFVDDDYDAYNDYKVRLARKDIELLYPTDCNTMEEIVDWIVDQNVKCVIIDYKLKNRFKFYGTELMAHINIVLPDLPCIMLTNFPEETIDSKLVMQNLIEERGILDADDIQPFVDKIKQAVEVFGNRLNIRMKEYENLLVSKSNGEITALQEERFIDLYKLLRAYGEVDDLPAELLNSEVSKKIDDILGRVNRLLNNTDKR